MDMINEIYIKKTQKKEKSFHRKFIELTRDEVTEIPKKGHNTRSQLIRS